MMDLQKMDRKMKILVGVLVAVVLMVGFRVVSNIMARQDKARSAGGGKVAVVATAHPKRQTITPKIHFAGSLDPVWQADVAAKVDGRIERVLVEEGQAVSAGQALVLLEQEDTSAKVLNAKGSYLDAKTNLAKAELDLDRYRRLYKQGAVSQERLDNAGFALENARARLDAATGNLEAAEANLGGTRVTTPHAGVVQKRYFQEGYYAKKGTALFNIADISSLVAKITIPEGVVGDIIVGGKVDFTIPSMAGHVKPVEGTITRVTSVAVQPSRTFEAEVTIPNHEGRLRGGVYADALISTRPKTHALTIPLSAIVMRDDQRTVFCVEDGVIVRKVITTGYVGEDLVEVLGGITEKDLVVIGGQNKVREGSRVKGAEAE